MKNKFELIKVYLTLGFYNPSMGSMNAPSADTHPVTKDNSRQHLTLKQTLGFCS